MISVEARELESLIDEACLANSLLKLGRPQATWQYLAFCEDVLLQELLSEDRSSQRIAMFTDMLINNMQYPLRWIWSHCQNAGYVSQSYNSANYEAAWILMDLANEYTAFETAFVYGGAERLNLEANGNQIVPSKLVNDLRYEAYDRLLACDLDQIAVVQESVGYAEQNLYASAAQLVGDKDPRQHEFTVQLRAFDASKSGAKLGVALLVSLCTALLKKLTRGGLIIVGEINLGGSIEPIHNTTTVAEIAVEKGASALLMPVACRRQLFDLSDDMATKVDIQFYSDARDALLKAIQE